MRQSRRIRVFGVGFFAGCILAAGIAFLRMATDDSVTETPLPEWKTATGSFSPPALPFPASVVKVWTTSSGSPALRWLVATPEKELWRVGDGADGFSIVQADRIEVLANPGIEPPALRAGLAHNQFEILSFDPTRTRFVVAIDPFRVDAIERAIQLLRQRQPYILDAAPIPYSDRDNSGPEGNLD